MAASTAHKAQTFTHFFRILTYVKPYKWMFVGSLLLAVAMAFISPIRPYFIHLTVNQTTQFAPHSISGFIQQCLFLPNQFSIMQLIVHATIFQVVFILLETLVRFIFSFITAKLGQMVIFDLRQQVFTKIIQFNIRQFDATPIGNLTTRSINDIESINDIFSDGFIPIVADILTIIFTLTSMFLMDVKLTLICLIPFPLLLLATYFFKEAVNKSFQHVRKAVAALNSFVQEHLTGMVIVQAFAVEDKELEKFKAINQQHKKANIDAIFAYSVFFPVVELILAVSTALIVWWVSHKQLNPGLLVAFILFINQIFRPLRIIADKFNTIQMGLVAAERVFKIIDNPDVVDNSGTIIAQHIAGKIEFDQVCFGYTQDTEVLHNLSFTIQPGQQVAFVGHTGSGKTTITSLINRMYQHTSGIIKIDDVPITDYELSSLRTSIGVVLQDVFLFSGTIYDNITLRNPSIPSEKVYEAAAMLDMHNYIMQLPHGYQTVVNERGNSLSLGQRQMISFIRAVLYNPAILILDEATSSVDNESEKLIQQATDILVKNRTAIIVAHRLSTIMKADKIFVLDKGKIVEEGTHQQLMEKNGYYATLQQLHHSKN